MAEIEAKLVVAHKNITVSAQLSSSLPRDVLTLVRRIDGLPRLSPSIRGAFLTFNYDASLLCGLQLQSGRRNLAGDREVKTTENDSHGNERSICICSGVTIFH